MAEVIQQMAQAARKAPFDIRRRDVVSAVGGQQLLFLCSLMQASQIPFHHRLFSASSSNILRPSILRQITWSRASGAPIRALRGIITLRHSPNLIDLFFSLPSIYTTKVNQK